jgi:hypothetical protein
MNAEDYTGYLVRAWTLTRELEDLPLAAMIYLADKADTVGPFVDPTLYQEKGRSLGEDLRMLRALRNAQVALAELKATVRA